MRDYEQVGAEEALDEILAAVSGDEETIGALNPALANAVQRAKSATKPKRSQSREIRGNLSEGEPADTFLPMTGGDAALDAGATATLTATPLRNFFPDELIISTDGTAVTVTSLTIAGNPMLAAITGDVPVGAFKPESIGRKISWRTIPATQSLICAAKNNHASATPAVYGTVYGRYTF